MTNMSSLQDNTVNPIYKSMLLTLCSYILSFDHLSLADCGSFTSLARAYASCAPFIMNDSAKRLVLATRTLNFLVSRRL